MIRRLLTLAIVAAVVALPACSRKKDDDKSATTTTTAVAVAPLTGLPDPTGSAATRSALTVKVSNDDYGGRPQVGLDSADIVFEEVAEGGITRFAAVFNSTLPEQIGPVRSVRGMDPDVVRPILGLFAYSGGTSGNVSKITAVEGLLTVNETDAGDAMTRRSDREGPNNLFVLTETMFGFGGDPKPPRPYFSYLDEDEEFGGEDVTSCTIGFEGGFVPTYTWDEDERGWLRALGEDPTLMEDGTQIAPENVVVQFIEYPSASEGVTVGEGDAWVFSAGRLVRGRWLRPDPARPPSFVDLAGEPIKLTPGRTWVELLPTGSEVSVIAPPPPSTTTTSTG